MQPLLGAVGPANADDVLRDPQPRVLTQFRGADPQQSRKGLNRGTEPLDVRSGDPQERDLRCSLEEQLFEDCLSWRHVHGWRLAPHPYVRAEPETAWSKRVYGTL